VNTSVATQLLCKNLSAASRSFDSLNRHATIDELLEAAVTAEFVKKLC
jgi:hypothetical protein